MQIGNGATLKSLIYTRDLAKAIIACMDKLSDGRHVLNVANPEAVSMKNLSTEIWHALGHNGEIASIPEQLLLAALRAADKIMPGRLPVTEEQVNKLTTETTLNVYKLTAMTDFSPTYKLGAALRAEIKWAKDNGLI
jgi:nucleoside-diphosphate-sugar epimerase